MSSLSSRSRLGPLHHPRMTSTDQQVGGCCQSKYNQATCFLGNPGDIFKCDQEDVQERCQSGTQELDVLRCPSRAWVRDQTGCCVFWQSDPWMAAARYAQLSWCNRYGRTIGSQEYASGISHRRIPSCWCRRQVKSTSRMHIIGRNIHTG